MWYDNSWNVGRDKWSLKFCWLPKKCHISGKSLWLTRAYRGTVLITGPGDAILQSRWHNTDEHLVWLLKKI